MKLDEEFLAKLLVGILYAAAWGIVLKAFYVATFQQ